MKIRHTPFALGLVASMLSTAALAAPAGRVLFTQPGTDIVNERGEKRAAKTGDTLETGDRLVTPAGVITQVLLPDGSLVGMRSGSELRFDAGQAAQEKPGQALTLVDGSIRLIGAELMDIRKASALTLQSGFATLKLTGADLESSVVKPGGSDGTGAGSYSRLLVGVGSVRSANVEAPLTLRSVNFVGAAANLAPVVTAAGSDNLQAIVRTAAGSTNRGGLSTLTVAKTTEEAAASLPRVSGAAIGTVSALSSSGNLLTPTLTTSTLTAPTALTGGLNGLAALNIAAPTVTSRPVTVAPNLVTSMQPVVQPVTLVQPALSLPPVITASIPKTTIVPVIVPKTCTNVVIRGKTVCL